MSGQTRKWLERIPQADLPSHLWSRILETRLVLEQQRRRRMLLTWGLANAAVLALLAAAWLASLPRPSATPESLQAIISRSQVLEERLLAYEGRFAQLEAAQRILAEQQQAQLTALDQSLAEAYSEGQSVDDLDALWRQRAGLVGSLLLLYEAPPTPLEGT